MHTMRKIRFLLAFANDREVFWRGAESEVADEEAARLVKSGIAELVELPPEPQPEPQPQVQPKRRRKE